LVPWYKEENTKGHTNTIRSFAEKGKDREICIIESCHRAGTHSPSATTLMQRQSSPETDMDVREGEGERCLMESVFVSIAREENIYCKCQWNHHGDDARDCKCQKDWIEGYEGKRFSPAKKSRRKGLCCCREYKCQKE